MLARRMLRTCGGAQSTRPFTTTLGRPAAKHTPSLADIQSENTESFNKRQREFREQLREAAKARDASGSSSNSPSFQNPGSYVSSVGQGLGSLSTATTGQKADMEAKEPQRKPGLVSNLIYGTKEGRELDAQIEASFSQVLARGKYVHSIVFHEVKPDCVDEYVDLVGWWYPKMAALPDNHLHLVGSWRTEVGDCDTFGRFMAPILLT